MLTRDCCCCKLWFEDERTLLQRDSWLSDGFLSKLFSSFNTFRLRATRRNTPQMASMLSSWCCSSDLNKEYNVRWCMGNINLIVPHSWSLESSDTVFSRLARIVGDFKLYAAHLAFSTMLRSGCTKFTWRKSTRMSLSRVVTLFRLHVMKKATCGWTEIWQEWSWHLYQCTMAITHLLTVTKSAVLGRTLKSIQNRLHMVNENGHANSIQSFNVIKAAPAAIL